MYSALVICGGAMLLRNLVKFLPSINSEIRVIPAASKVEALNILANDGSVDIVVCDHSKGIDAFDIYNDICKNPQYTKSFIITTDSDDVEIASVAFEYRMEYYIHRTTALMAFYMDLAQKIIFACERHKSDLSRDINTKRMNAAITLAEIRDRPFSEVLSYALETSVSLTGSEIGYVATYNASTRKLNIIAWSIKAMGQCKMINRPMEYDLDISGVWGEPIRIMDAVIIDDYEKESVYHKNGIPQGHVPLKNLLMVPIIRNGVPVATAGVGNKNGQYTDEDRVQFSLLIDSLISIYRENLNTEETQNRETLINELLNTSPYGILLIGRDFSIKASNKQAAEIFGITNRITLAGKLTDLQERESVRNLIGVIDEAFIEKTGKMTFLNFNESKAKGQFLIHANIGLDQSGEPSACLVVIMDTLVLSTIGYSSVKTNDKIRTITDAIQNNILRFRKEVEANGGSVGEEDWQYLDDIKEFSDVQKRVSTSAPVWQKLSACVPETSGSLKLTANIGPVNVLADSMFGYVFKALIGYSLKQKATEADVSIRMQDGKLLIRYTDNGTGVSHSIKMAMFSGHTNLGLWAILTSNIIIASGFKIREIGTFGEGLCVEIEVPSNSFTIG